MTLNPYPHFLEFWQKNPALYYGLAILFGIAVSLQFSWILVFPIALFGLSNTTSKIFFFAILLLITTLYAHLSYTFPDLPPEGVQGNARLEISSVRLKKTFFGKQWVYRGRLSSFENVAKNIDFSLQLPYNEKTTRPPANQSYVVFGTLKQSPNGSYFLKVGKNTPWYPIPYTFSFAEWRFQMKTALTRYITNHHPSPRAAAFLAGIATGDFDDLTMSTEFAQFGLQHIMAISGFHFAIIASILSSCLKFVLSKRHKILILIALLSAYFLFLGCGPSIMRAWMAIFLALLGMWIGRQGSGLNSLGFALILVLIVDPLLCFHIGFQFSFLITAAILLLYGVFEQLLQKCFFHRSLGITSTMTKRDQFAYCTITTLRQGLALTLAVNLVAVPMTLYYFHSFPYLSLIYNLFFPFLVSISMLFLLMGFFVPGIDVVNNHYTTFILNFTHQMPRKVNFLLEVSLASAECLVLYLTLLFAIGIFYQSFLSKQRASDFVYL